MDIRQTHVFKYSCILYIHIHIDIFTYIQHIQKIFNLFMDSYDLVNHRNINPKTLLKPRLTHTGMDIKQHPRASAVVTLGKDMTFRDYAQGCYRMRGLGSGQRLEVIVIPEVEALMQQKLTLKPSSALKLNIQQRPNIQHPREDIPAWLLLNSMSAETLAFCHMTKQELDHCFRQPQLAKLILGDTVVVESSSSYVFILRYDISIYCHIFIYIYIQIIYSDHIFRCECIFASYIHM